MAKNFGKVERDVLAMFKPGAIFVHNAQTYKVITAGKPGCRSGEPKTDIFVLTCSNQGEKGFKISVKKPNADFLENKITAERAEQIFGYNWKHVITTYTGQIRNRFEALPLIYKNNVGKTRQGAITLGWKFELVNKTGGNLSGLVDLTHEQLLDVYAGINMSDSKKNAVVNNKVVKNSGVADFLLIAAEFKSPQNVIDSLHNIDEYVKNNPNVFFACKALNYLTLKKVVGNKKKYDGNRPLSVAVDWHVGNGKLAHNLIFDQPLLNGGDTIAANLEKAMKEIGAKTTDDL